MLIKIDDATAINMQHAVRLYVSESVNGYEVSCVTLYNVYTIKKCEKCWIKYLISMTEDKGLSSYKGMIT